MGGGRDYGAGVGDFGGVLRQRRRWFVFGRGCLAVAAGLRAGNVLMRFICFGKGFDLCGIN